MSAPVLLYCHCQYAQVVPAEVKKAALQALCESGQPFEAAPDLCELSARRDPVLARMAAADSVKIAACFPRAVKWLFHAAGAPLSPERTQVVNMRTSTGEEAARLMLDGGFTPNLPSGKVTQSDAPASSAAT